MPPTLRFVMDGEMPDYLLAKDLILQVSLVGSLFFLLSMEINTSIQLGEFENFT